MQAWKTVALLTKTGPCLFIMSEYNLRFTKTSDRPRSPNRLFVPKSGSIKYYFYLMLLTSLLIPTNQQSLFTTNM